MCVFGVFYFSTCVISFHIYICTMLFNFSGILILLRDKASNNYSLYSAHIITEQDRYNHTIYTKQVCLQKLLEVLAVLPNYKLICMHMGTQDLTPVQTQHYINSIRTHLKHQTEIIPLQCISALP